MKRLVTATVVALGIAPATAKAVEIGECSVVERHSGAYANNACTKSASGTHEWRELEGASAAYTDGHPQVLRDEPQLFSGPGVKLACKGNVTVGEVTSFTTNTQLMHDYLCELLEPERAACFNVDSPSQIETAPESGMFVEGEEGSVFDQLTLAASFTCGSMPASIEGVYEGLVGYRREKPTLNTMIHKYDLKTGEAGDGAQTLTLTVGLRSWPVVMSGEQEDRYGTSRLVVRTAATTARTLGAAKGAPSGRFSTAPASTHGPPNPPG